MAPTFQLSNITLSSTNASIPNPAFGLQNVMNVYYDLPNSSFKSPSLFPNACRQSDGSRDCTSSCLNSQEIFASLDTLHNCVVWPSIYVADEKGNLSAYATDLATSLGLEKGSANSPLPSKISNIIQTCLLDTCTQNDECRRKANHHSRSGDFRKDYSVTLTGDLYNGFNKSLSYFAPCQYISAGATADVAGIGVFISYAMQMGLALIAFVLAIPWKKTARGIRDALLTIWRKWRPLKESSMLSDNLEVTKGIPKRDTKQSMKFDPALAIIPAVVEFHKAQCYFMLATNIAGLIVQTRGGLAPESLQELYNTYIFIKVIAIGGYLPITFVLLILRMLNKVCWYLLALSTVSVGVAIGNLYTRMNFSPSLDDLAYLQSQSVHGGPDTCGGNNPITWCYDPIGVNDYGFRATNSGDGADDLLKFCLVTLGLLIIEHFWHSPDCTNRKIRDYLFRSCLRGSKADQFKRLTTVIRWLWKYVVPALFVIFIVGFLYCFAVFADDLNWFRMNEIYDPTWGFGQIVAILVWAPPMCEYLWESFRGIEDGSDHRLPDEYEVRKKEVTEDGKPEGNESSEDLRKEARLEMDCRKTESIP